MMETPKTDATSRSGRWTRAVMTTIVMLGAPWLSAPVDAAIVQQVTVSHILNGTGLVTDHDLVTGATPDEMTRDILAQLGVPTAYQAVAAAGRFGSIGTAIGLFESGVFATVISDIDISADFTNVTGVRQQGTANFVIDGGSMLMIAARNASIRYTLTVSSVNLDRNTRAEFDTFGVLAADQAGQLSFQTSGPDIGATLDPTTGRVEIPPSFQSLDLGILEPGDPTAADVSVLPASHHRDGRRRIRLQRRPGRARQRSVEPRIDAGARPDSVPAGRHAAATATGDGAGAVDDGVVRAGRDRMGGAAIAISGAPARSRPDV